MWAILIDAYRETLLLWLSALAAGGIAAVVWLYALLKTQSHLPRHQLVHRLLFQSAHIFEWIPFFLFGLFLIPWNTKDNQPLGELGAQGAFWVLTLLCTTRLVHQTFIPTQAHMAPYQDLCRWIHPFSFKMFYRVFVPLLHRVWLDTALKMAIPLFHASVLLGALGAGGLGKLAIKSIYPRLAPFPFWGCVGATLLTALLTHAVRRWASRSL